MVKIPTQKRDTLTVSQLNRQAKRLLEGNFSSVWIVGEISNFSRPSSGHWYFTLKDSNAQVRCAMFRSSNNRLRFQVESGQLVMVRAKLSLYEARGDYQLIVEHMELAGDGALAQAFEELKAKLQVEGLFNPDIKQDLPKLAQHIAVVTSPTGAAIHDILTVLERRFPLTKVTIIATTVQGQGAAQEISKAIGNANRAAKEQGFDVLLVSRGGGSLEDLWSFNEEIVARAIFASDLPVVSAVGHEIDFTIADFVADIRAPTPSAAAEMLSPDQQELEATLIGFEQLLRRAMNQKLSFAKQQLQWLQTQLKHPDRRLREHTQRLDELEMRLFNGYLNLQRNHSLRLDSLNSRLQRATPKHEIEQIRQKTVNYYQRMEHQILQILEKQQQQLNSKMQLLNAVSPLATLDRGYAIVSDEQGKVVNDASAVKKGQSLKTRLSNGSINSTVDSIEIQPRQATLI